MDPRNELPAAPEHLLLPKAHVHFFGQVVVLVIGILLLLGGIILLIIGSQNQAHELLGEMTATEQAYELLFFLASGIVLGLSVPVLLAWALWKFVKKYRIRFVVSLIVSALGITIGLLFVALLDAGEASNYTFFFFSLTIGLFSGLLSLFYFFSGFSRHLLGTHK